MSVHSVTHLHILSKFFGVVKIIDNRKNSLLKCFGLQKISIIGYALLFPVEWHIFLVGNSFTLVLAGINIENKHGPESSIKYLVMNVYLMI